MRVYYDRDCDVNLIKDKKVAIVHEWLDSYAGSERVLSPYPSPARRTAPCASSPTASGPRRSASAR